MLKFFTRELQLQGSLTAIKIRITLQSQVQQIILGSFCIKRLSNIMSFGSAYQVRIALSGLNTSVS